MDRSKALKAHRYWTHLVLEHTANFRLAERRIENGRWLQKGIGSTQ